MNIILFLFAFLITAYSQAQLAITPALTDGELRLSKSLTYVYIKNNGSTSVSTSLSIPSNAQGVAIKLNRCNTIRAKQTCYFMMSFNNYKTNTPSFSLALNNGASLLATIVYNAPTISPPVLLSSSSGSTSSGGGVTPEFYVKTIGLGSFSYNSTSNIFYSWGLNYRTGYTVGQQDVSPVGLNLNSTIGQSLKLITVGQYHVCGVGNTNNSLYCWGINSSGALGLNPDDFPNYGTALGTFTTPQLVNTSGALAGKTIKQVGVGSSHTCVIASDDKVYCWGANSYGQLGNSDASRETKYIPVAVNMSSGVLAGKTAKMLNVEGLKTCIIANDNKVYCWGYGDLGDGIDHAPDSGSHNPVAVSMIGALAGKTVKYLSTNAYTSCIIANDDKPYCWGYNGAGQLGDGTANDSLIPIPVNTSGALSGKSIKSVFAGDITTCALTEDNKVFCWGSNWKGGLGDNVSLIADNLPPTEIYMGGYLSGKTIKILYVSKINQMMCVIASDDKGYCWGDNSQGQLGAGLSGVALNYSDEPYPIYMAGALAGKTLKNIHISDQGFACASASDNNIYCWGYGIYGQLGNGLSSSSNQPVYAPTP